MKFLKKIIPIAVACMFGATCFAAADLADWKTTYADARVVVSSSDLADVYDTIAASNIATALNLCTPTDVTDHVLGDEHLISAPGDDLSYAQAFNNVETSALIDNDLTNVLADGIVLDESTDDEIDYTQELALSADTVVFQALDEDEYVINTGLASDKVPLMVVDQSAGAIWTLTVDLEDDLDAGALEDSETIEIAGKTFTFDPGSASTDEELVLYASEQTVTINVLESKTVIIDDDSFTIEVTGANIDKEKATIKIEGKTKYVAKGDSVTVEGQKFYINDVIPVDIPEESAQVEIFVGANEITIDSDNDWNAIDIDGDDIDEVEAKITDTDADGKIDDINKIEFRFIPSEIDEIDGVDVDTDEYYYLEMGESIVDPLFGTIEMKFTAPTDLTDDTELTKLERSGDDLKITFTNREGNEITITPYTGDGVDNIVVHADWFSAGDNALNQDLDDVAKGDIFILQNGADITDVYKVKKIDDAKVEFYSYADDDDFWVDETEELANTGAFVCGVGASAGADTDILKADAAIDLADDADCNCSGATALVPESDILHTENKLQITLGTANVTNAHAVIELSEANMDEDEAATTPSEVDVTIDSSTDNDMEITTIADGGAGDIVKVSDDGSDFEYTITDDRVTYMIREEDDDSYLKIYAPEEELDFDVYINEVIEGAVTPTVPAGYVPVTDAEADTFFDGKPLISVGGSAINEVTAKLLGLAYPTYGTDPLWTAATGVTGAGMGIIKEIEDPTLGTVAMVVAGWEGLETNVLGTILKTGTPALSGASVLINTETSRVFGV